MQLCFPPQWSGVGDVTAQLAISSRFAPLRADTPPAPASDIFYTGEASVPVHATRSKDGATEVSMEVPRFAMHGVGTGSTTETTGIGLDAVVRGSVRLVP